MTRPDDEWRDSLSHVAVTDKVYHQLVDPQHELQIRVATSLYIHNVRSNDSCPRDYLDNQS